MTDNQNSPPQTRQPAMTDLIRPIVGIENRTAQEVFDIMVDRIRRASPASPQNHLRGDLVDLLRAKKTHMSHGRDMVEQQWPASDLEIEAAVEIERLRSHCQQLLDILENYQVEIEGEDNDLVAMITRHVDPGNATTEGQDNG